MSEDVSTLSFLVVAENDLERIATKAALHSTGARNIRLIDNGPQALTELKHVPADIVIFDWDMSSMSGREFTFQVRSNLKGIARFAILIAVCNDLSRELAIEAMKLGVHDFIDKPMTIGSLSTRLRRNLENPKDFIRTGQYFGPCHDSIIKEEGQGNPDLKRTPHPLAGKFAKAVLKAKPSVKAG